MRKRTLLLSVALGLLALLVVVNWTWGDLPGEPPPRGAAATLAGIDVRWVERSPAGERRAAPPVVLLHGLPGTADDFARVTPLLSAAGHRTIALDRPGFGFSDGGHHPLDEQLATLDALLDRLAPERPIVVGHSFGGTLALAYAARRPERLRGLVLVAASAGRPSTGAERAQARFAQILSWPVVEPLAHVTFGQALLRVSARAGVERAFAPDPVDREYERRLLAVSMQRSDLDAMAGERLAANDVTARVGRQIGAIDVPAVVIQGAGDRLVGAEIGRRLARELPRARLVEVARGHMVPLVAPAVIAEAVRSCAAGCGTH
ncbi:alpha/beta fold hydrolase [Conexibacter arvalis]|uniref:Pimeloyl-ACP methyl ester carboxylesterase n=1 Tax=Conexibacter arvalis TaxID=912552 RepID=A0A840I8Q3_9ACTN|nr:alpha/beta hydrolase [Conexibacter arvalis]MBB4661267.1 pimeloyl-ACP methyl ester carboxylesterase [Conexibacter arvalis]